MPYYVFSTDLEIPVEWRFEPKFPMSDYRPFLKGEPVTSLEIDRFPKNIVVSNYTDPKDFPEVIGNGADIGIVNIEVKKYLEENDPGLHSYFPISVHLAETEYKLDYFFVYSDNHISSVCYEKTVFQEGVGKDAARKSLFMPKREINGDVECYLYKNSAKECSVWRNPAEENVFVYFFSDEFVDFLKRKNIRGWACYACKWED